MKLKTHEERFLKLFSIESLKWIKNPDLHKPLRAVTGITGFSRQHMSNINRTLITAGYINESGTRVTKKGEKYLKDNKITA